MKLLAVSHSCVTDVNQQLYVALNRLPGVRAELVVPAQWKSGLDQHLRAPQRLEGSQVPLHPLPVSMPGNTSLFFFRRGLAGLFHTVRPDLVFLDEEPWSLSAAQMARLCRRYKIPLVVYTKQNILKRYPPPFRWIERRTYETAAAILALSEEVRDVLRNKGYSGPCPLLPHGCDLSLFFPAASDEKRAQLGLEGLVIGYMGRLTQDKGLETLIEATALLHAEGLKQVSLLIVGGGRHEAELKRLAAAEGLGERCLFTGVAPHREAGSYLNCMDLFVLPSRTRPNWKEQFGRVIVEALACGVPVVGSSSGQIPYLIADTGGGLTFREGDANDLAAKLRLLAEDPARRTALGQAGKEAVRCRYTYDAVAQQLYGILREALT